MTQTKLICHETRVPLPVSLIQGLVGAGGVPQVRDECDSSLDIMTSPYIKLFGNNNDKSLEFSSFHF